MTPVSVHRFARATSLAVFVLIVAGASVTSTGSGLAVPDWPRSYGQWMPPMQGGVFFEHGHRMIAGLVALMVWALVFLAWKRSSPPWVRRLTLAAGFAVLLQAVLGGLTVLYGLAKPVSVLHACLAQALFSTLVFLAVATAPEWARPAGQVDAARALRLRRFAVAAALAVFVQLVLGAAYRHGLSGVAWHFAGAFVAAALILAAAFRGLSDFGRDAGLAPVAGGLAAAILAQVLLGVLALGTRSPIVATVHVGAGALILALSVVLAAKAHRLAWLAR